MASPGKPNNGMSGEVNNSLFADQKNAMAPSFGTQVLNKIIDSNFTPVAPQNFHVAIPAQDFNDEDSILSDDISITKQLVITDINSRQQINLSSGKFCVMLPFCIIIFALTIIIYSFPLCSIRN